MNLSSMRDLNTTDPLPGLGPKVEPRAPVNPPSKEHPLPRNPHVIVKPDGKFETAIPENRGAKWACREKPPLGRSPFNRSPYPDKWSFNGTVTGRLSTEDPAWQELSRSNKPKIGWRKHDFIVFDDLAEEKDESAKAREKFVDFYLHRVTPEQAAAGLTYEDVQDGWLPWDASKQEDHVPSTKRAKQLRYADGTTSNGNGWNMGKYPKPDRRVVAYIPL